MNTLQLLKGCELHTHVSGCLYPEDILSLGRAVYNKIDWSRVIKDYEEAYEIRLDPHRLFRETPTNNRSSEDIFRRQLVFSEEDGGNFDRFQAKFNFFWTICNHYLHVLKKEQEILKRIVARHRREGLDYVEYRAFFADSVKAPHEFLHFHRSLAQAIQQCCSNGFTARYIISLPRDAPELSYELVQQLFKTNPELIPTIVGLDFCYFEEGYPPETVRAFFSRLHQDNDRHPSRALEVVYHVGESYFDKSIESAIRWCHEVADIGSRRLGHAIALGLDPSVAITRRPHAHEAEIVSERMSQIVYDLRYHKALARYDVILDTNALKQEMELLKKLPADTVLRRPYNKKRLQEICHRQDFVLNELAALGTTIESCPTSNLRIGAVPSPSTHPLHRFLKSQVNLVIGADDPGIFDSSLSDEIDWVIKNTKHDASTLVKRLGDPRRFRLGQLRQPESNIFS